MLKVINNKKIIIVIIGILAFFSFVDTLRNPFVYDDVSRIVENSQIKHLSNIPHIFSSKYLLYFNEANYRPLGTLTLFLNYKLFNLDVYGWRLFNILLHIINSILIYLLIWWIFRNNVVSFITAILFAVHPIHTETVNVIVYRTELLACMFFLISFYTYLKAMENTKIRKGFYAVSLVLFILGLCSKLMVVSLPIVLVLYDYFFLSREKVRKGLILCIPFFIIIILWVTVIPSLLETSGQVFYGIHYGSQLGTKVHFRILSSMGKPILRYIWVCFFPLNLVLLYPSHLPGNFPTAGEVLCLFLLFSFVIFAFMIKNQFKEISFSTLYFFITLLPVSQIIPFNIIYAERYLYIPSIGYCMLVAILFDRFLFKKEIKKIAYLFLGLIFCFYLVRTLKRNIDWRDDLVLFEKNLKVYPQSMDAHLFANYRYLQRKNYTEALKHIRIAHEMYPANFYPYFSLGEFRIEIGQYDEAIKVFSDLLKNFPQQTQTYDVFYYDFGKSYAGKGLWDKAIFYYNKCISLNSLAKGAHNEIGNCYYYKTEFSKAIVFYESALSIDPYWIVPYHNLIVVYKRINELEKVAHYIVKAIRVDPSYKGFLDKSGTVWSSETSTYKN
ncbi:MAG: tetratricopeptide repeat protein [Elusimicrobia bacterium]|nr:tetratricopeptide repeat protein [Elusimicrobiota bacterium]